VNENVSAFLQIIFMTVPKSYFVAHQLLKIISAFFRFYPINKEILEKTIEYSIQRCIHCQPEENLGNFTNESLGLRREGFITLIKLASTAENFLLEEFIPYIISRFNELHDKLMVSEKAQVTEILVTISNGFNNYAKQQEFLTQILNDQVERWANDMTALLTSPYDFLNFFGVNQISETDFQANKIVMDRITEFVLFVAGLVQIMKRAALPTSKNPNCDILREGGYLDENNVQYPIKHPLVFVDMKILPNLLKLVTILHSINNPSLRANIPADWQMIFFTGNIYLFKDKYRVDVFSENSSVVFTKKKEINCQLQILREHVYTLFSTVSSHKVGFYPVDGIREILRDSVFNSDLYFMGFGNAQDYINKVIIPLILNCPPYLHDAIMPLYCEFLVKYYSLILSEWTYNKPPNEKEEFLHDITKHIALSEFVNCLKSTLFPKQNTDLINYLLESKTIKFGLLLQLMADLTNKKINTLITDIAYGLIKSTITYLAQSKSKTINRSELLNDIFSFLIDFNSKIVDIELMGMMFTVDHNYSKELLEKQTKLAKTEVIKKELQLNQNSFKNIPGLKTTLKNFFRKLGYTVQPLNFMELKTTET
jgi:uncharacterized protein YqgQ